MTRAATLPTRRALTCLLPALLLGLLLAGGCSDDTPNPTYPDEPLPPVGTWFLGVWGSAADDVFVVGQPGLIYHWNGADWQREQSGTTAALTDVWGDGTGVVYATGHNGTILRRSTGGTWSAMASGTSEHLYSIGRFQGRILAIGNHGTAVELVGQNWVQAPQTIYTRGPDQAVLDTLILREDVQFLTAVGHHGVTGNGGIILMTDPEADWQRRRVTGGVEVVTCATSNASRVAGNFVATDNGRLFQLGTVDERLVWTERYSPAFGARIYGMFSDVADTVWVVTNDGRINRVAPPHRLASDFRALYNDEKILFDVWGTNGTNLYAVGIDGRVLHFSEVDGEYAWRLESLPDLPATKSNLRDVFDKFGRPVF